MEDTTLDGARGKPLGVAFGVRISHGDYVIEVLRQRRRYLMVKVSLHTFVRASLFIGRDALTYRLQTREGTLEMETTFEEKGVSTEKVTFEEKEVSVEKVAFEEKGISAKKVGGSLAGVVKLIRSFTTLITVSDDEGDVLKLQTATACHLMISNITPPAWRGDLDNQVDAKLLDLHDRCYARQAVFDKNPAVMVLYQKIMSLLAEVKQHKESVERMLLESQKWAGYQENLTNLESKVFALKSEKNRLEVAKATLCQEVKSIKSNRAEVVSKVVPYVTMVLLHSDEMAMLVGNAAFEEVADMKEPFDLVKVKGYRPSYKKEHTKPGNDLASVAFPFLTEVVADPSALVET
ncbi:hypothetical protein Tco_0652829 [Tanacetum coccineum]|uniref:Uncharacterized protein n=1 Tax=Tanacetum coccineum TaxID=301880 RepID=A0ABQ4WZG9_9ASTR